MAIACVVLDLDGTLTDLSQGDAAFSAAYVRLFADLLGKDLSLAWPEEERRVLELSPDLAWEMEGAGVAPADADPYVLASCVAQRICDRFLVLADRGLRSDVLRTMLHRAYGETKAALRPEARHVIETLLARGIAVHVVTNAATHAAQRKLETLAIETFEKVRIKGDAAKFLIGPPSPPDERFARVPAERRLPGLSRPLLLGRGRYFDALTALWTETGARPESTLVCGDIFELDLALPAELGAHVHLVQRQRTHRYEIDAVRALGTRGGMSEGLAPLLERLS